MKEKGSVGGGRGSRSKGTSKGAVMENEVADGGSNTFL